MPMRVRKIEIRNFRAHRKSVVEFSDGINLIIGQNGMGRERAQSSRPSSPRFTSDTRASRRATSLPTPVSEPVSFL